MSVPASLLGSPFGSPTSPPPTSPVRNRVLTRQAAVKRAAAASAVARRPLLTERDPKYLSRKNAIRALPTRKRAGKTDCASVSPSTSPVKHSLKAAKVKKALRDSVSEVLTTNLSLKLSGEDVESPPLTRRVVKSAPTPAPATSRALLGRLPGRPLVLDDRVDEEPQQVAEPLKNLSKKARPQIAPKPLPLPVEMLDTTLASNREDSMAATPLKEDPRRDAFKVPVSVPMCNEAVAGRHPKRGSPLRPGPRARIAAKTSKHADKNRAGARSSSRSSSPALSSEGGSAPSSPSKRLSAKLARASLEELVRGECGAASAAAAYIAREHAGAAQRLPGAPSPKSSPKRAPLSPTRRVNPHRRREDETPIRRHPSSPETEKARKALPYLKSQSAAKRRLTGFLKKGALNAARAALKGAELYQAVAESDTVAVVGTIINPSRGERMGGRVLPLDTPVFDASRERVERLEAARSLQSSLSPNLFAHAMRHAGAPPELTARANFRRRRLALDEPSPAQELASDGTKLAWGAAAGFLAG